jgi:hypothetical protein
LKKFFNAHGEVVNWSKESENASFVNEFLCENEKYEFKIENGKPFLGIVIWCGFVVWVKTKE